MIETGRPRFMSDINVVPLVDVVLVLLVIFMVTAPMLYRGLDINLPRTATNTIKPEQRVVVTVERNHRVYVDKEALSLIELQPRLHSLRVSNPEVSVFLRADRDVPYGIVVQVMDAIKKAGIEKLGMVTDPIPTERVDRQG
jgi:biopolymer transport protein TolR